MNVTRFFLPRVRASQTEGPLPCRHARFRRCRALDHPCTCTLLRGQPPGPLAVLAGPMPYVLVCHQEHPAPARLGCEGKK